MWFSKWGPWSQAKLIQHRNQFNFFWITASPPCDCYIFTPKATSLRRLGDVRELYSREREYIAKRLTRGGLCVAPSLKRRSWASHKRRLRDEKKWAAAAKRRWSDVASSAVLSGWTQPWGTPVPRADISLQYCGGNEKGSFLMSNLRGTAKLQPDVFFCAKVPKNSVKYIKRKCWFPLLN